MRRIRTLCAQRHTCRRAQPARIYPVHYIIRTGTRARDKLYFMGKMWYHTAQSKRMEDDDEEETYKLVTSIRGNSMHNMVSIESPLGKAILRHKVGDRVEITTDNGYSYFAEIRKIEDIGDEDDTIRKF